MKNAAYLTLNLKDDMTLEKMKNITMPIYKNNLTLTKELREKAKEMFDVLR